MNTRKNNNKSSQSSSSSSSFNSPQLPSPNQFTSNNNMLSPHEFEISIKHMNDRLYYGLLKSIGNSANITLASDTNHNIGNKVTGILHTVSELNTDGAFSIVLKYPVSDLTVYNNETLIIHDKDILLCDFKNIDFNPNTEQNSENSSSNNFKNSNDSKKIGFRTDTDISGNKIIKERELQKWSPDEGDDDLLPSLDDDISNSSNRWDQFEVNKSKFGIESTYDETLYTTKVSTDAPDFQERLKEADRLAKEIESQGYNGNMHLAEERGIQVDDSGVDEEDKYSGVLRENKANEKLLMGMLKNNISTSKPTAAFKPAIPGQYVPPNQRAAQYHQDPAVISSSATLPPKPKTSTSPTSSASASTSSTTTSATTNTKPQSTKSSNNNNNPNTIPKKPTTSKPSESQNMKKEIEDLKKFSTNLKISSEMPSDVASIVHKDKIEQLSAFVPSPKPTTIASTANAQQSYPNSNAHAYAPAPPQLQHKHHQSHQHPIQQQTQMNSPMLNQFQQTAQHNYSINQNQQQQQQQNTSYQQRHKRNIVSFFGPNRIPSEDGSPRNVLNLTFNILISAKNEFIEKNRNNKDILEKTIIIPIDKPFNTQPVWPKTIDKPFEDFFSKEEEMPPQVMNSMPRNMFPMMNPAPMVMSPPMMDQQHPQTSHNMPSHNPYQAYNTMPAANPYMYPFQMPMVMIQQPVPGQNYSYVPPVYQPNAHMPAHMQHGNGNNGRRFHQNHNNKHVNSNNFR